MAASRELAKSDGEDDKLKIVEVRARAMMEAHPFIQFRGDTMVLVDQPYGHYIPLTKEYFEKLAYNQLGGLTRGQLGDVYNFVIRQAPEMDEYGHQIRFGITIQEAMLSSELNTGDIEFTQKHRAVIYDTKELALLYGEPLDNSIWHCPYPIIKDQLKDDADLIPFILSLAGGDIGLYWDIMQSIAPMIMDKKPDGVIWFVGEGANGKSTLMNALYRMFPHRQLTGLTVKALEDGRDAPALNRALANIVGESSEGRIEDTSTYKALGTHENFKAHIFHQQRPADIIGNIHSIFSANQVPSFNDKGHSARRRTYIIPFGQTFESDPGFEDREFTPELFGRLAAEMIKAARQIKARGYRYQWSIATTSVKAEYDREAGVADEYMREMVNDMGLVAFDNYRPLTVDFQNWCAENGYTALGEKALRKSATAAGFSRVKTRSGTGNIYRLHTVGGDVGLSRMSTFEHIGLYVMDATGPMPTTPEPAQKPEEKKQTSILNNKW